MSVINLSTGTAPDGLNLSAIKRRFLALNRERLLRVQDTLRARQRAFMELLPLLFHVNHPLLPGYESKKTIAGVSDYTPTQASLDTATRLFKGFDHRRRALRQHSVLAIYLMGSSGTIAYSESSDFDIWICHRPDLGDTQCDALRRKADAISAWAASMELEAHFFIMDVEAFRRGEHEALSHESSGSTQHHLLLEEFYRTGLLVAGRYPLWWLVPPAHEQDYDTYAHRLTHQRFIKDNECLDFGGLGSVPAGEFFGAALWQLYKAVGSPYKSVLKILLMEAYANEYPHVDLLASRYKKAIYAGTTDLDHLDPYLLMCTKVEEYLKGREEHERLELARRCFYFKVNERLSIADDPRRPNRKRELLRCLAAEWQWDHSHLLMLDSRPTWKIHRVLEERKSLVDELTRSYRMLSEFARLHAHDAPIDQGDLNMLGRKLYAAFERKAGKIDIVNPGISTNLVESQLSFHQTGNGEQEGWLLYRGEVNETQTRRETPIKRARNLIELLTWCHFNKLLDQLTVLALYSPNSTLNPWEVRAVSECLQQLYPDAKLPDTGMDALQRPPRIHSAALFINFGIDPLSKHTRQGKQLTSNRTDALRYGGQWENLAISFDQIVVSSWQEILTLRYTGDSALLDCLCEYLAWTPLSAKLDLPPIKAYSYSSTRGAAIAHRIEGLFQDVAGCYGTARRHRLSARYVLHVEHSYYVLQPENDVPRYQRFDSYAALLRHLGSAQSEHSPVFIDRQTLTNTPLPQIYEANKAGVVQLFYWVNGKEVDIYVIDEKGSLFHQNLPLYDTPALLNQFRRFLESALRRRDVRYSHGADATLSNPIEFYQVQAMDGGRWRVDQRPLDPFRQQRGFFDIQVIGDMSQEGTAQLTMYCADREFSTQEFGEHLFPEVARYILERRASGELYPIYITDIDISRTTLGTEAVSGLQTVHFLNYKKRIEKRLNDALTAL